LIIQINFQNFQIWKVLKSWFEFILFWIQFKFGLEIFKSFDLNPIPLNQKIENNFYFPQAAWSDFGPKAPGNPPCFYFSFHFFSEIGLPSAPSPLGLLAQLSPLGPIVPFSPRVKQSSTPPTTGRSAATLLTSNNRLASRASPLHPK
jgi:hypothetical protein